MTRARFLVVVASVGGCGLVFVACGGSSGAFAASQQLVTHYEPSQSTGWPAPYTPTIGGHRSSVRASYRRKTYRISLLRFGQTGSSPDPVYEAVPTDREIAFKKTLERAYGRHFAFRYLGGLPAGAKLVVESYGVRLYRARRELVWGADLYLIYQPGNTGPAISGDLQFIQVIDATRYALLSGAGGRFVDAGQRPGSPTPYYGEGGGLTSINGQQVVNFYDPGPQVSGASPRSQVVRAETFLAKDTGRRNTAGKQIVNIYGGIKWGYAFKPR